MSTLKVTNIQNNSGGNTSTADEIYSGRAKAWVNFDGTFGTSPFTTANGGIRAAFNVSSVTDLGLGKYTANFTNAMPDTDYAAVAMSYFSNVPNADSTTTFEDARLAARTTSSFTLATATSNYNDSEITSIVIFR